MQGFEYRDGELVCEGVSVSAIAADAGTPAYVYSAAALVGEYRAIAEAFAPLKPTICFSIKSLSNLHVLALLREAGSGFDVVSGGELARALTAGADPGRVVYAGVAKTDREIRESLAAGIGLFNVESEAEFENISRLAAESGTLTRAALRINPDVYDPKTHSHTATGRKESKFGVDINRAEAFYDAYGRDEFVALDGIDLHIGSPIYSPDPYVRAISKTLDLIDTLSAKGFEIRLLDIGGGYASDYERGASPRADDYAAQIVPLLEGRGLEIVLEPGRKIAADAGILLTEVQYTKDGPQRSFVIVDAAMTDLIRPALYGSEHFIWPVRLADGSPAPEQRFDYQAPGGKVVDVVGGVCESSDFLCQARSLPPTKRGDVLAVFSAGAYGSVMGSQYNSRPRPPEILVQGDSFRTIRRRETYDDLTVTEREV